jgi:hypothetical protein
MSFENEGTEVVETTDVASDESSSETQTTEGSESGGESNPALSTQPKTKPETDTTPFHEHPRFKELVEQKNSALKAQQDLAERYAQMEARLTELSRPKTPSQEDALIARLKGIDPEFAERIEKMSKILPNVEQMQTELSEYKKQQVISQAVNQINSLHESNKVSPELKTFINNEFDRMYALGQLKDLSKVGDTYKAVHDTFKKYEESVRRAERESYVKAKGKDSKIPSSQPKGTPANQPGKKGPVYKDRESMQQDIVKRFVQNKQADTAI